MFCIIKSVPPTRFGHLFCCMWNIL